MSTGMSEHRRLRREGRRGRNIGVNTRALWITRLSAAALMALPVLILAVLALKFVTMPIVQAGVLRAYDGQRYDEVHTRSELLDISNHFEPYLIHLSRGTALLAANDSEAAELELQRALDAWMAGTDLNAPPHAECKIRNNLAIAVATNAESLGDEQRVGELERAIAILAPCQSGGASEDSNEDSEATGHTSEALEEQRKSAAGEEESQEQQSADAAESEDSQGDQGAQEEPASADPFEGDSAEQQRQRELSERNSQQDTQSDSESEGSNGRTPTKPW